MENLIDGFYGLEGGMNSALSPHLIEDNQYHVGFNVTSRGGQVSSRPAFKYFAAAANNYRNGHLYTHSDGSMTLIIANGASIQTLNATASTSNLANSASLLSTTGDVYFCTVGSYVVIQDGTNTPVVLRAPATSSGTWSNVSSSYAANIPIGTHMAYGHGRLFVATASGAVAPTITVNMTPTGLSCTVTNGGAGYNVGATRDYTQTTPHPTIRVKTSLNGTTFTNASAYTVNVVNGRVTGVSVGGNFSKVPIIKLVPTNNAGTEVENGSLGAGAEVVVEFVPTSVASITATGAVGLTLNPTVFIDNSGTGGSGASFSVTRITDTLTFARSNAGSGYKRPPRVVLRNLGGNSQEIIASDITYGGSSEFFDIDGSFPTTNGTVVELSQDVPFNEGEPVTIEGHSSFPPLEGTWAISNVGDRPSSKRGVSTIVIDEEGSGYKAVPKVLIGGPAEGGRRATATAVVATSITAVKVTKRGAGYSDNSGSPEGANIVVELRDQWPTTINGVGFQAPVIQLRLGDGKTSADKVDTDKIVEAIVEDGGGPYPARTLGRVRVRNPRSGQWEPRANQQNLPFNPPPLIIRDGYGVVAAPNSKGNWVYPKGKGHGALTATVSGVVSEIRLTDSGAGYTEAPSVEILGKSATPASARAILDGSTTRDPKVFTIPAITATKGVGGRVKRALAGKFEDIFNFTETTYLAEGGGFSTEGFTGKIRGMFFLPVANSTSGRGDLVVLGEKGAVTMAVANARTEWKDIAFIRVILTETGAVSNNAFTVAEGDVFFYSKEGLRSYRNAKTGEVDGSVTPLDTELYGVLGRGTQSMSRLAYCDNRVLFTTGTSAATGFPAIGVLDWTSSYAGPQQARPAWDGFWFAPSVDPGLGTAPTAGFRDVFSVGGTLLAVCSNGFYKLANDIPGDQVTSAATQTAIKWVLETRAVNFKQPASFKRLMRGSIWVQDSSGNNSLTLSWRTENRPNWTSWVADQQTTSVSPRYSYRLDLPIPGGDSTADTDKEMRVGNDRGQHFQFRIEGSGKLRLVKFMFYALPIVESQYGVVQTTAATIVPTGTSEPYPI